MIPLPELREAVVRRDRRTGNNSELPPMEQVPFRAEWLHTYLLLGLDADFPVSEAIFHVMTWGRDFEGKGHRQALDIACDAGPVISWHGYQKCNNPEHVWHMPLDSMGRRTAAIRKPLQLLFTFHYAE